MPKLKRDVRPLLDRAIESLTLAIELFNRPSELARGHAVLILLHHGFELLLKAAILQRTGTIHEDGDRYTYGFARCLQIATEALKILTADERATLSILDAQRDQVTHYYTEVSEDLLYVHTQSAVTLFDRCLSTTFGEGLASHIPTRILPVSARPPTDLALLIEQELSYVDSLIAKGKRQGAKAEARLRAVMAFATGARDAPERVSTAELATAVAKRRKGRAWEVILPEVAQLSLSTDGTGIPITMRISKDATRAFRLAQPGEEVFGTLVKQEVNLWDTFTLSLSDVADKLGLTSPKTLAFVYELKLQNDPDCYRELSKKKTVFKGYSKKALDRLRAALAVTPIAEVWARQRHRLTGRKKRKPQQRGEVT